MEPHQVPSHWANWCKSGIHGIGARKANAVKRCLKDGQVRGYLSELLLDPEVEQTHSLYPSFEHLNDPHDHADAVVEARIFNRMKLHLSEEEFWQVIEHLFSVGVAKAKITAPFGKRLLEGWSPKRHFAKAALPTDLTDEPVAATVPAQLAPKKIRPNPKPLPSPLQKPLTFKATVTVIPKVKAPPGARATQTINFPPIPAKPVGAPPFTLTAKSSAGLKKITFSLVSGPAEVTGNKVTLKGPGKVTILANQAGTDHYAPATKKMSFSVKAS